MKKIITLLLSLTLILGLCACAADDPSDSSEDWFAAHENDAARFAELYPVTEDNPFVFATYEELVTHLEYGTGVIAFGFPDCPRCKNAFPVLEKAFYEMNMDQHAGFRGRILYYDMYDDREENNERYQTVVGYLEEFLRTDDSGNPRLYMPDIYFIASGTVMGNHLDTVESLTNPRDSLNYEQEAELLNIYKGLIQEVEDCDC